MINISFIGNLNSSAEFASKWRKKLVPDEVKAGKELAKRMSGTKDKYSFDTEIEKLSDKSFSSKMDKKIYNHKYPRTKNSSVQVKPNGKSSLSSSGKTKLGYSRESFETRKQIANNLKERVVAAKRLAGRKRLGMVGAGVITLGAIGYGIARKIRSDKGRKRK